MADSGDSTNWRKLREFAAVDLSQSFVLSWAIESETLLIDVDLHLTPEHAFYEQPRPAEKVCIRPAVIEFPVCESIICDQIPGAGNPIAATAELGLGAISDFHRRADGHYVIDGVFGKVRIDAERPVLRLKQS